MRLVALLSWYSEPPAWLAELVASLGRAGVDHVVAVDGAYFLFPQGRARSESDQADVIARVCAGAGMGCTLHVPQTPWYENEVGKRDFLFRAGHLVADAGTDWLWVCDGDEVVTDAPHVRRDLADTELDVAEVLLTAHADPQAEVEAFPLRKLFRAQPGGISVVGNHFTYVAGAGTDESRVLWTYSDLPQVDAVSLHDVRVEHRLHKRPSARILQRMKYYERRDEAGVES